MLCEQTKIGEDGVLAEYLRFENHRMHKTEYFSITIF